MHQSDQQSILAQFSRKVGDVICHRYRVQQICVGGFGVVYLCRDTEDTRRPYALKTLLPKYLQNPEIVQRYRHEIALWVSLHSSNNIVQCYGVEEDDGRQYAISDWIHNSAVPQSSLRALYNARRPTQAFATQVMLDVAWGLVYAQARHRGFAHCDIKPENILIHGDDPYFCAKVTDFGLACLVEESARESRHIAGTPMYMAPEQWVGAQTDERTDIYAIGCVLYELLVGSPPFPARTREELEFHHIHTPAPRITVQGVADIAALAAKCLEKESRNRVQTLKELVYELVQRHGRTYRSPPFLAPPLSEDSELWNIFRELLPSVIARSDFTVIHATETIAGRRYDTMLSEFRTLLALHEYDRARVIAQQLTEQFPRMAEPHNCHGDLCAAEGKYDEAITHYSSAISIDRSCASSYDGRAKSYWEIKRHADAMTDIDRAIQLAPSIASPYTTRGYWHSLEGRFLESIADLNKAITLDAKDPVAYTNLGYTHVHLGMNDEAFADYNHAVECDPNYANGYLGRGTIWAFRGEYRRAVNDFRRATQLAPDNGDAHYNLAVALTEIDETTLAVQEFDRAVKLGCRRAVQPLLALLTRIAPKK